MELLIPRLQVQVLYVLPKLSTGKPDDYIYNQNKIKTRTKQGGNKMSIITAKGSQVAENVNKTNIDFKKVFIRLKDGESVKVRLLGVQDYVEYKAHANGFNIGVYTQPCIAPTGVECPLCTAHKSGIEEFEQALKPSYRYLVAMADIESGELRVWDCSKKQLKTFISQLEEYKEIIEDGDELAFTFKRTGNKTDTSYTLSPILKLNNTLKEGYAKFDGQEVEISFFEQVLQPRSEKMMVSVLKEAGFPTDQYFPHVQLDDSNGVEPVEATEDNPLDHI